MRVIVVTQTQGWVEDEGMMLDARKVQLIELEQISSDAVKLALLPSSRLSWLAGHDDTIAVLTNLRTLAWVIKAGDALGSNASGLASHTAIAEQALEILDAGSRRRSGSRDAPREAGSILRAQLRPDGP